MGGQDHGNHSFTKKRAGIATLPALGPDASAIRERMKSAAKLAAFLALISVTLGTEAKETMCVKQKDGTYLCKASGKIEKAPCCDTPTNPAPKGTPRPKR